MNRSTRIRLARATMAVGTCLVSSLAVRAGANPMFNACAQSSQMVLSSCQMGARADRQLALGTCDNIGSMTARKACIQQAAADLKDALQTCGDQFDARQAVCGRLGPGPYDPPIDPADFVARVDNPLFPLTPGTTFVSEGQTAAGFEHDEFNVTHNTRLILGVTCIEVHDTSIVDGQLNEDTLDWFAQDIHGNVWYFGENATQLEGGRVIGVEGSWKGGIDGAKPGIVMEAHNRKGDFYRQEFSLDAAEDMAEVIGLDESVEVKYGSFEHCLKTRETSPLEPDALEEKFYCEGVGNVLTHDIAAGETLQLVKIISE